MYFRTERMFNRFQDIAFKKLFVFYFPYWNYYGNFNLDERLHKNDLLLIK